MVYLYTKGHFHGEQDYNYDQELLGTAADGAWWQWCVNSRRDVTRDVIPVKKVIHRMRTRYKISIWLTMIFVGILISIFAGQMYASYFWPKELRLNTSFLSEPVDFEKMVIGYRKAKPIADTANGITLVGNLFTAGAVFGLAYTSFMHFKRRKDSGKMNGRV